MTWLNRRPVLIVCCAALALVACSHRSTPAKTSTAPAQSVDSLIVGVEDARRIADFDDLAPNTHEDMSRPSRGDIQAPGPCRAAGNSDLTFGSGWTAFRSVVYSAQTDDLEPGGVAPIDEVSQAVAKYGDSSAARRALHELESSLQACAALHDPNFEFTLDNPDASTLRLSAEGWNHLYREKSSILISVGVLGLEPADQIADTILATITDRIK